MVVYDPLGRGAVKSRAGVWIDLIVDIIETRIDGNGAVEPRHTYRPENGNRGHYSIRRSEVHRAIAGEVVCEYETGRTIIDRERAPIHSDGAAAKSGGCARRERSGVDDGAAGVGAIAGEVHRAGAVLYEVRAGCVGK